jgi:trimethylamine--corrinoid protein Co-methyltransferase
MAVPTRKGNRPPMTRETARSARRAERRGFKQLPWRSVVNPYQPFDVLAEDQVVMIEQASFRVLEELGIEILSDEALGILAGVGCAVDRGNRRVRMGRDIVRHYVGLSPAVFTLHARNPARNVTLGDNHINFTAVSSPPNSSDLDHGRRPGNFVDFCNFLRVAQSLNVVHFFAGYPVEPIDLPVPTRHLDCYLSFITLTDRVWRTYALGRQRCIDGIDMMCIARGIDRERLAREPGLITMINTNSPLRLDGPMAEGLMEMARAGQAVAITPFTLAGAMSPVTLAGALTQQNAEALAVIAFTQMVNPGTPVMYGGFTSNVDMKTGAPAFGTPEYALATLAGGQFARRYRIPYRSSNVNAANVVDAQAAYESEMSVWAAVLAHANMVHHGAGWLEGGLCASFEKMIIDAEILQMMVEFLRPLEVNEATIAFDAIAEVGPGGHFFGTPHTLARYETAFYAPIVSDWRNFETWKEAGGLTATERANAIWKDILRSYEPPPLDRAVVEELEAFVAKGKERLAAA